MKKYIFDVHYDMVIRGIEVMADSIGEAAQIAKDKAARLPMESAECVEQDAQPTEDPQELSEREVKHMENEKVQEFVGEYVEQQTPTVGTYWPTFTAAARLCEVCACLASLTPDSRRDFDALGIIFWTLSEQLKNGYNPDNLQGATDYARAQLFDLIDRTQTRNQAQAVREVLTPDNPRREAA